MTKTRTVIQKTLSASLSPELVKEYGVHSIPIRKGDTVIPMRGNFRDVEGKVTKVDRKNILINVEGIVKEKSDGRTIFLPIHPSKVRITKLNLDDRRRKDIFERKTSKPVIAIKNTRTRKRRSKSPVPDVKDNKDEG